MKNCPICQHTEFSNLFTTRDYFYSQESFEIVQCLQCGFRITNPIPKPQEIGRYYNSENYVSHNSSAGGLINTIYKKAQRLNFYLKFRSINKFVPRGTWMDYGAGNGAFIDYIKSKNKEALGYEPSASARLNSLHTLADTTLYKSDPNKYACITMWHVLEHVHNLNDLITQHYNHLQPGGVLVIAVPNIDSYDSYYYGSHWAALDTPRHLWHFTECDLKNLLEKHNFQYLSKKGMILDSFYVSLLSEKYKKGFKPFGILVGLFSNLIALFKRRPYSSQIYVFRKKSI